MQSKTIVLFERGINGFGSIIGEWHNWPNQAITWVHKNTEYRAQTLTYFTSPWFAGLTRHFRALNFSKLIRSYSCHDWRIIGVGHSEGTATFLLALRLAGWPRVESLHLLCGAANADFRTNGLNWALKTGAVGQVHCYTAGNDGAMWQENTWLGKLFFDLPRRARPLGLTGPRNVDEAVEGRVKQHRDHPWHDYGHSDCWLSRNFDQTLKEVLGTGQ